MSGPALAFIDGNSFYCSCETRMFAARVSDLHTLEQAIAAHAPRLAEKLRREGLGADRVTVFFHTSPHDMGSPQRSAVTTVDLPEATSDALALAAAATRGARRVWREGYRSSKAGVITNDLVALDAVPRDLLDPLDRERAARLMAAMDACNARHGRGAVVPAKAGMPDARAWATKFEMRSPAYTTRLGEVPIVGA